MIILILIVNLVYPLKWRIIFLYISGTQRNNSFQSNGRRQRIVYVFVCSCICLDVFTGEYAYIILLSMYGLGMYRIRWLMRFTRFEFTIIKNVNNNIISRQSWLRTLIFIINVYRYNNTTHLYEHILSGLACINTQIFT